MKIHIVCKEPKEDRILYRLARTLADHTGWSMGRTPRGDADINYFIPYLDFEPIKTLTAAWFTHLDSNQPEKIKRWTHAAQSVGLRTTSTTPYLNELTSYGATVKVPPPIDHAAFTIATRPAQFSVGVSGYTYEDGRKGEDLIRKLSKDFDTVHWKAIGRGWSIPTKSVELSQLPGFYQSLSLFVCASRIEGVPYPPLEALACGVPIVIPRGVGLLDDLPDIPGIYRFEAGNYAKLKAAFARALKAVQAAQFNRDALRAATLPYSPRAWAQAHERAFEDLVSPPAKEARPDWRGKSGIYCVAFGDPARECADRLLKSCQQYMPDVPTALVSDRPLSVETCFIQEADYDIGARRAKLKIDELTLKDWEYLLYLDADTELIAPIPLFFELLQDGYDFVICLNPPKYASTRMMVRPDNRDECEATYAIMGYDDMIQFNGGVFAYHRTPRTAAFFKRWIQEWMIHAKRDQAALLRALWATPLRIYTLNTAFNSFDDYCDPALSAGILHHQREARRVSGIVWERGDSEAAFKKVMR